MAKQGITYAKLFRNGRSQAVRLPKEYNFEGERVRIRRLGRGVLLEPAAPDLKSWFETLDRLVTPDFMEHGREQPAIPDGEIFD